MLRILGIALGTILLLCFVWRHVSERYVVPCPSWLSGLIAQENPIFWNSHAKAIIEHIPIRQEMYILEVGCGPGRVTIPLAKALKKENGHLLSLDMQSNMLDTTRAKIESEGLQNISLKIAQLGVTSLEKETYDVAVLINVLGELPKNTRGRAARDLLQALKVGGILSISELIADPHFQSKRTVRTLLEPLGFIEVAEFGHFASYTLHFQKV